METAAAPAPEILLRRIPQRQPQVGVHAYECLCSWESSNRTLKLEKLCYIPSHSSQLFCWYKKHLDQKVPFHTWSSSTVSWLMRTAKFCFHNYRFLFVWAHLNFVLSWVHLKPPWVGAWALLRLWNIHAASLTSGQALVLARSRINWKVRIEKMCAISSLQLSSGQKLTLFSNNFRPSVVALILKDLTRWQKYTYQDLVQRKRVDAPSASSRTQKEMSKMI